MFANRRARASSLAVLAGYCVVSLAYGWRILAHPGRELVGLTVAPFGLQRDPELFVWSFAWWPHAIEAWTNPFFTHAIYAPVGINLAWTTSVPGLALIFSPVTVLFGPAVAYNVASLVLPALSAWTAYLLCRYLTNSTWASLVGGYLFGFSSFVLAHEYGGDLNFTAAFLIPPMALVLVRYARDELDARALAWRLALLLGAEFWISLEVTLTFTIVLALALTLAFALIAERRRRLVSALAPTVGAYAIGAVLASPLLAYLWIGPAASGYGTQTPASDLLNLVVPTHLAQLGGSTFAHLSAHFPPGWDYERGSYLGLPALLVVVLLAIRRRHVPAVRFLVATLVLGIVLVCGSSLYVDGHRLVAFPWRLVAGLPVVNDVQPQRFMVFVALATAVAVALWTATTKGRVFTRPYMLPALAVVALIPAVTQVRWTGALHRWPFFTQGLYKSCVARGETLAIFPFGRWGDSMVWQAESGFWFKMAEGDMGRTNYPPNFVFAPVVSELQVRNDLHPSMSDLLSFARSHHVGQMVSVIADDYPTFDQMYKFGVMERVGGVVVSPACGTRMK